jgi:hypothetical protein
VSVDQANDSLTAHPARPPWLPLVAPVEMQFDDVSPQLELGPARAVAAVTNAT